MPLPPLCRCLAAVCLAALAASACGRRPLSNFPPRNPSICCYGDSLVAGVGAASPQDSYPAQLGRLLDRPVTALGRSGDTTGAALARLPEVEKGQFGIVIVTLGGNDILQQERWADSERHYREIFGRLRANGAVVVFTAVTGPLHSGLEQRYRPLCDEYGVLFVPDIMRGIIGDTSLKADGIHPNAAGYKIVAQRVQRALRDARLVP